jgi:hypothetical protein
VGVTWFGLALDDSVGVGSEVIPFEVSIVALGTGDGAAPAGAGLAMVAGPGGVLALEDGAGTFEGVDDGVGFGCGGGHRPAGDLVGASG